MGEIAKVNNIDIWWEDYGDKSNPTVLLITVPSLIYFGCVKYGARVVF